MSDQIQSFLDGQSPLPDGWIRCLIVNHDAHKVTVIDAERANLKKDADFVLAALKRTPNLDEGGYREMLAHTIARFVSDDEGNAAQIVAMAFTLSTLDERAAEQLEGSAHPRHMCVVANNERVEIGGGDSVEEFADMLRMIVERMDAPRLH